MRLLAAIGIATVQPGTAVPTWDSSIAHELERMESEQGAPGAAKAQRKFYRPRPKALPSPEAQATMSSANMHYLTNDLQPALELLTEVIRREPAVVQAYEPLAAVYEDMGDFDRGLQLRVIAAHLTPRPGEVWKALGHRSRQAEQPQLAIYCFYHALRVQRDDVDVLWSRADAYGAQGNLKAAIADYNALLRLHPHDPSVIRKLVAVLVALGVSEIPRAIGLYVSAFAHFRRVYPAGPPENEDRRQSFDMEDLLTYASMLHKIRRWGDLPNAVKANVRWLQGRGRMAARWDAVPDDREYDVERKSRDGWADTAFAALENEPIHPLDPYLRCWLGLARLSSIRTADQTEAARHFAIIRQLDVATYSGLFGDIGDAFFARSRYAEALEWYLALNELEDAQTTALISKLGVCYKQTGDYGEAVSVFELIVQADPTDRANILALADAYENAGDKVRALELVEQVLKMAHPLKPDAEAAPRAEESSSDSYEDSGGEAEAKPKDSFFAERKKRKVQRKTAAKSANARPTLAQRLEAEQQRQEDFELAFSKLDTLQDGLNEGDPAVIKEWLDVASFLVDGFRQTRELFPSDLRKKFVGVVISRARKNKRKNAPEATVEQQAADMATRLQQHEPTPEPEEPMDADAPIEQDSFRGVAFDDWVTLILQVRRRSRATLSRAVRFHPHSARRVRRGRRRPRASPVLRRSAHGLASASGAAIRSRRCVRP